MSRTDIYILISIFVYLIAMVIIGIFVQKGTKIPTIFISADVN